MKNGPEKFVFTDEGNLNKLLGIEITHIIFTQHRQKQLCYGHQRQINHSWEKIITQQLIWETAQRCMGLRNDSWYSKLFAR